MRVYPFLWQETARGKKPEVSQQLMAIYALSIKHKSKGTGAPARAHAQYIAREGKYRERNRGASAHTDYLTREGRYTHRAQELEQTWSGNLPSWAQSAKEFWDAADLYERANGRVYTEVVIALPRELSKEARREVVNEFIDKEIGDRFPYTAAIHNPKALDGGEQPHVHIMFSLREQDGIERGKELFFKRANDRDPSRGGAKKSREWSKDDPANDRVNELRARWETLANRALKRAGRAERIDRRSLQDQGIEREPEPKMGPEVTQRLKRGEVTDVGQTVLYLRDYRRQERELRALEEELGREKAKVYQFPLEQEERVLLFSKVGKSRAVPEEEKRRYQRVLDLVFDRKQDEQGHIEYRWKRSGKSAFVDEGDRIRFTNSNETAIKAGVQLAKEKGWTAAHVEGSEAFRREFWIQAQLQGLGVTGYEHTKDDELEVEKRREELRKKKESYKEPERTRAEKESPQREHKRSGVDAPEYRASDLEREVRRSVIPLLEDRTRAFGREMKQLGFNADGVDPLSWHYKIKKMWDDLPTDDELKAKTFAAMGGTAYAKLKTEAAQTNEKATQSAELLQQFDEQPVGGLQRLNPARALERTRLVKACKEAEKAAKEAEKAKADEEKRLSSGPNAAIWMRILVAYQAERSAVEARRVQVEREYRAATAELGDALSVQRKLKTLGDSKIRARVRAGKMPEIDAKELDARIREHEQKKEQQHNIELSRSRFRR